MKKIIKNILTTTLIVSALVFSVIALPTVNVSAQSGDLTIGQGATDAQGTDQPDELFGTGGIFQVITNTILYVLGAVSVIMLIYGGIRYTISGGDSAQVTSAKNTIMYAIVGVVVALLAYAIINFVIGELVG